MPRPTGSTTLQRPDLAKIAVEYVDDQKAYVGLKVAPLFMVEDQAADYPVFPVEAATELPDVKRAPRGAYNRGDWEFETDTYACVEKGWEEPVDEVEAKLYARYFDVEKVCAKRATGILLRAQEKRILDQLQDTGNFSATSVSNEWDDATNATPYVDVKTGKETIEAVTGLEPDVLVIAYTTYHDLGMCSKILDRIKYTHPEVVKGELSRALLAEAFGIQEVLVSRGAYNSAKKGQTAVLTKFWDEEYAFLCCTGSSDDLTEPQVMRTFLWKKDSPSNLMVESYYENARRSDVIRVRHYPDEEILWAPAGYLMDNIAA